VSGELTTQEHIKNGDDAFIGHKYENAIQHYSQAIESDPSNYRAFYKRATVYQLRNKHREALGDLNQVTMLNPDYHLALVARGKLNKELGKFTQAKEDLQKVVESKRSSVKTKAQAELDGIIKLENQLAQGNKLFESQNYQGAKEQFTIALEKAPSWVAARFARAKADFELNNYPEVIDDTMKLLKIKQNDVDAILLRGNALKYFGDIESAQIHYASCLKWDSEHAACKEAQESLTKFKDAMDSAEKRINNDLGKLALTDIEFCLAFDPRLTVFRAKLLTWKCKALLKAKSLDAALEVCNEVLGIQDSNEVHKLKGEIFLEKEEYDQAIREFEKVVNSGDQSGNDGLHKAKKLQKMAARKDYYKILGVAKNAGANQIKKAYRNKAVQYHPDKVKHLTPEEQQHADKQMKELGEAYAILSNEEKRTKYDNGDDLDMGGGGQGFNPFQGFNFNFQRGGW